MLIELLTDKYPGMRLWLSQRLSALVMAVYIVCLIVVLLIIQPNSFIEWHTVASNIVFKVTTFLFFVCLSFHAWLGVRDVMRDYVFNVNLRNKLQVLVDILLLGYLAWAGFILWVSL